MLFPTPTIAASGVASLGRETLGPSNIAFT